MPSTAVKDPYLYKNCITQPYRGYGKEAFVAKASAVRLDLCINDQAARRCACERLAAAVLRIAGISVAGKHYNPLLIKCWINFQKNIVRRQVTNYKLDRAHSQIRMHLALLTLMHAGTRSPS
jgi:hypothetical protein